MELHDTGQKVLCAKHRSRRGWPRPARSTTGYALCSSLNRGRRPWVGRRRGSSSRGRTATRNCICRTGNPRLRASVRLRRRTIDGVGRDCGPFCIEPRREFGGRRATLARRGDHKDGEGRRIEQPRDCRAIPPGLDRSASTRSTSNWDSHKLLRRHSDLRKAW